MPRHPRTVHRAGVPLLAVLFAVSAVSGDVPPGEGGAYRIGVLSWAALAMLFGSLAGCGFVAVAAARRVPAAATGARRRWSGLPLAAAVVLGPLGATGAAAAESERMRLECDTGLVVERTNGSAWWGVAGDGSWDGSVYTTRYLKVVDAAGKLQYEHHYGHETERLPPTTCVASHFGWTWTSELVRVR